jgi:hypothetical protein
MKKIFFLSTLVLALLSLAGCFETTDEITLKSDGSGTIQMTNDMSMLISMAKTMGGEEAMKEAGEKPTDTTISLSKLADSIATLTPEEKELIRNGSLSLKIDMKDEKMITRLDIPFANIGQIEKVKSASSKVSQYFIGKNMGEAGPEGMGMSDKMPASDPLDEYFTTTYSKNGIEKKLNKEKYATLDSNIAMKSIKDMADNGMPLSNSIIINLPRPAKTVEGKNVKLSEDKRKVTISSTSEEFFDTPASLEFKIVF